LRLFPLGAPQRSRVPHQSAHYSGFASGNWSSRWRDDSWQVAWHSWQFCGSFTGNPRGRRISYWTCAHTKNTCT